MKLIRYTVIIVFCLSLGVFLIAKGKELISKDPTLPTITSDRDVLEIPCEYTQEQLLDGLSAFDKEDGDLTNKILVGNTHGSFTRIQTIAHECLHSIQDRKILIFNFIYSNIYFLYWIIICGLVIFKKLSNEMIYANILLILI